MTNNIQKMKAMKLVDRRNFLKGIGTLGVGAAVTASATNILNASEPSPSPGRSSARLRRRDPVLRWETARSIVCADQAHRHSA